MVGQANRQKVILNWNKWLFLLLSFLSFGISSAQKDLYNFLKPSDSLNSQRRNTVVISEVLASSITLIVVNVSF